MRNDLVDDRASRMGVFYRALHHFLIVRDTFLDENSDLLCQTENVEDRYDSLHSEVGLLSHSG